MQPDTIYCGVKYLYRNEVRDSSSRSFQITSRVTLLHFFQMARQKMTLECSLHTRKHRKYPTRGLPEGLPRLRAAACKNRDELLTAINHSVRSLMSFRRAKNQKLSVRCPDRTFSRSHRHLPHSRGTTPLQQEQLQKQWVTGISTSGSPAKLGAQSLNHARDAPP